MSYSQIQPPTHRTPKKRRWCEWCDELIEVGDRAMHRKYRDDEFVRNGYSHIECFAAQEQIDPQLIAEGWMPGDFKRGSTERNDEDGV